LLLLCALVPARAQQSAGEHSQHHPAPPAQEQPKPPGQPKKQEEPPPQKPPEAPAGEPQHQHPAPMAGRQPPAKPAREPHRMASGTAWQPDSTPAHMWMTERGKWTLMAHGNLFLTFNHQGGPRGAGKFESMNWAMFMEQHALGRGTIEFRQMFSAEPLTAPHPGFPQLFQTGETYRDQPLVDHQHPHDVFGEISALYTVPLSKKVSWDIYGAPAGEPALGPVAFMHRGSAAEIPAAPLSHHLQDATHITAGVVTTGLTVWKVRGEVSVFNGREPDQVRHTIDFGPLDSWSARLSVRPSKDWSLQYSYGHIREQEIHAGEPGDTDRQTASLSYNRPFGGGNWATSLIWGRNHKQQEDTTQNSYLLESIVNFKSKNYAYTRLELADKDELFPAAPPPRPQFRVGGYTFGGVRDLVQNAKGQVGIGADVTFYSKPAALDAVYGESAVSFRVFLRFRPGRMEHH
jgi:hypothetical protein